jgi:hypothetical protein
MIAVKTRARHPCRSTRTWFLLLLICTAFQCMQGQVLMGKIVDEATKEPIPFALIVLDQSNQGVSADLDGHFRIQLPPGTRSITIQLIGYEKKTLDVSNLDPGKTNLIQLKRSGMQLAEVVIQPGENPAIPIIQKVIDNMPKFDISNLPHYVCNTYAKTYFTISDQNGNEDIQAQDTTPFGKIFSKTHLLFMESTTEKKYKYKGLMQEKVTASRVSGFKSAPFGAFASLLQSFTFYDEHLELMGLRYLNPLSKGTFKRYRFEIADTVLSGPDTTILIRFYPKPNATFKALKGVLYINKNQYALSNVLAEPSEIPADGNAIRIQQLYERLDSLHWFPKQASTELYMYSVKQKDEETGDIYMMKGVSRLYVSDVRLDSSVKIKDRSIATYNEEGFDRKDESYWNSRRNDSLSQKEQDTYHVIDSVGKKRRLDAKVKWFNALGTGQFQVGYVAFDLKHLLRVNEYENVRLGLGLSTSNKLSRYFSIGGYGGYGFGDKAWKYGGQVQLNFNRSQTTFLKGEAASEVIETAGTFFLQENGNFLSTQKIRDLLIRKMDKVNFAKGSFNFQVFHFIKLSAYLQVAQRHSPYGYASARDNLLLNEKKDFTLNETGLQFKIWPKEKFVRNMDRLMSLGSKWPVIFINMARGLQTEFLGYTGDFDYAKIDLRIDHQLNFKVKGFFSWQVQAGKVFGDVPYSIQYNNKSSRSDRSPISAEKTFETMYLNEFISTQYAAVFLAINTGRFLKPNKRLNPELELVHNYGIGTLDNRQNLTYIELNDMSKGYSEAGIRLKALVHSSFSAFGLGVFYRYGNYAAEKTSKNFVYKLTLSFSF